MDTVIAYVGMGSNVGNRAKTLIAAAKQISDVEGVSVRRLSNILESEPVGGPEDQGKYLNAVVEIETGLEPVELLHVLQGIEAALGRRRTRETRWGPRTCDLDILLMADIVMETEELTVPHPRMHERVFVLRPLASLAPQAVHPKFDSTIIQLLAEAEVAE